MPIGSSVQVQYDVLCDDLNSAVSVQWPGINCILIITNCRFSLFSKERNRQDLPSLGETGSDPFADFKSAEQGKREEERSSNWAAKKPKLADQSLKLSTKHGQHREVSKNVDLNMQLDQKTAECATLKSQVTGLQLPSVSVVVTE